jgi:hypothetical protein
MFTLLKEAGRPLQDIHRKVMRKKALNTLTREAMGIVGITTMTRMS